MIESPEERKTDRANIRDYSKQNNRMAWLRLSNELFSLIMMEVGLKSLDDLHRCRQVCRQWNEKILILIWGTKSSKRIMKERIERSWGPGMLPTSEAISHVRWLEDRGILDTEKIQKRIRTVLRDGMIMITEAELKCGASLASNGLLGAVNTNEAAKCGP